MEIRNACQGFADIDGENTRSEAVIIPKDSNGVVGSFWMGIFKFRVNIELMLNRFRTGKELQEVGNLKKRTYLGEIAITYDNVTIIFHVVK